jgi:hypothetical protein
MDQADDPRRLIRGEDSFPGHGGRSGNPAVAVIIIEEDAEHQWDAAFAPLESRRPGPNVGGERRELSISANSDTIRDHPALRYLPVRCDLGAAT